MSIILIIFQLAIANLSVNTDRHKKDFNIKKYKLAYNKIVSTDEYLEYAKKNKVSSLCLSLEVLPHHSLSKFFLDEIKMDMISFSETFGNRNVRSEIKKNRKFKRINKCNNGEFIMYLTEFYDNMVFAEILIQGVSKSNYGERTVLGESLCYCVIFENNEISNYSIKRIANN